MASRTTPDFRVRYLAVLLGALGGLAYGRLVGEPAAVVAARVVVTMVLAWAVAVAIDRVTRRAKRDTPPASEA